MTTRQWHYFSINLDISSDPTRVKCLDPTVAAEDINDVLRVALNDYGIGLLTTTPKPLGRFGRVTDPQPGVHYLRTEAAVCCSTSARHERVCADLFSLVTRALIDGGYRFDAFSITHDLTEPDYGDNPHNGADIFAGTR